MLREPQPESWKAPVKPSCRSPVVCVWGMANVCKQQQGKHRAPSSAKNAMQDLSAIARIVKGCKRAVLCAHAGTVLRY